MIKKIGIIGGNSTSSELARLSAGQGIGVILVEQDKAGLDQSIGAIRASLEELTKQKRISDEEKSALMGRIQLSLDMKALSKVDFILADTGESEEALLQRFRDLDQIIPPQVTLASTSSTVSITRLARTTRRPSHIIGFHFIPPLDETKFVEVIRGVQTGKDCMKTTEELAQRLGMRWILSHDFPGYIVYRVLAPMINEAVTALYEGIGSAEDIDRAVQWGANQPKGPLATADSIGLDKVLVLLKHLYQTSGNPKFCPCPLLQKYVEAGFYGKSTGKGFYDYKNVTSLHPPLEKRDVA